jgi:hypothetical protein
MNTPHESAAGLAATIAAVSVAAAVVASRSALAAMKSADEAMVSAQKKFGGTLPPPITITVNKKIDWARNFIGAIDPPLATVLTLIFSIALGVRLSILLSRSDSPSGLVPTATAAAPASPTLVSPSPPPTSAAMAPANAAPQPTFAAAAPASKTSVSAQPPPTATAAAPADSEIAGLLARARAYLSDGDVALARVYLRRAAERDDPQAALVLAATYDPAELRNLGIPNFQAQADPSKARKWYRRAADLGSAGAALRLEQLQ